MFEQFWISIDLPLINCKIDCNKLTVITVNYDGGNENISKI